VSPTLAPIVVFRGVAYQTINGLAENVCETDPVLAASRLSQFWVHVQEINALILRQLEQSGSYLEDGQRKPVGDRHFSQRVNLLGHDSKRLETLDVGHKLCAKDQALGHILASSPASAGHSYRDHLPLYLLAFEHRRQGRPRSGQPTRSHLFQPFPLANCPGRRRAVHDISTPH